MRWNGVTAVTGKLKKAENREIWRVVVSSLQIEEVLDRINCLKSVVSTYNAFNL